MAHSTNTANLAEIIRTRLLGIPRDDQDVSLDDADWHIILAAISTRASMAVTGDDLSECLEILNNLTDSIARHGNYSAESTIGFIDQAKQCLRSSALSHPEPVAQEAVDGFAETLNFYISDSENGISRVPRQKLVEIQTELRRLAHPSPSPEQGGEIAKLTEWKQSIIGLCKAIGSDDMRWGGDKTGWGFIFYFVKHLHTRAESAEAELSALRARVAELEARATPQADTAQGMVERTDELCSDCPPVGYPTDKTRCEPCPRRAFAWVRQSAVDSMDNDLPSFEGVHTMLRAEKGKYCTIPVYLATPQAGAGAETLQARVQPWMMACFGPEISADKLERGDRLAEEVFELLQSGDYPRERLRALEDYVWAREKGEPFQEVGGVQITLAAYCLAHSLDMHEAGEAELARIWTKVDKIRAKQAAKPVGSALPVYRATPPDSDAVRALKAFAESFHFTVTDSFYNDAYIGIHEPDAVTFRLANNSTQSKHIAKLEQRRKDALAALSGKGGSND